MAGSALSLCGRSAWRQFTKLWWSAVVHLTSLPGSSFSVISV